MGLYNWTLLAPSRPVVTRKYPELESKPARGVHTYLSQVAMNPTAHRIQVEEEHSEFSGQVGWIDIKQSKCET